nr:flagellar hook-basal body complex protein [Candidatus Kapabacteria bacterium]
MSLTRALCSGASSLQAHQKKMDVVSNNIANVNTVGYKSSRALFSDEFSQIQSFGRSATSENSSGGTNPLQYGLGVQVASVTLDMKQGNMDTTDRPLDLALQGDGFFVYSMNGKQLYSRAGAISR